MLERIRHSKLGRKYLSVIYTFICELFLNKLTQRPDQKTVFASREFFSLNKDRIDRIKEWLADERSRHIYDTVISARTTGDIRQLWRIKEPKPEYFPKDIIRLGRDEVFVDCGAFNGDTIRSLFRQAKKQGGNVKRVFAFEPAALSFSDLSEFAEKVNANGEAIIIPINKGTWDREETLSFSDNTGVGARITKDEEKASKTTIHVTAIDKVCQNENVTFIKMDVEGAELPSLRGATETILRCRPKLAVCLYHSDDDILRLIEYIHEVIPDYRFHVRHYGDGNFDTILYCV